MSLKPKKMTHKKRPSGMTGNKTKNTETPSKLDEIKVEKIKSLVRELELDDVDELAELIGTIARMFRYKGFDWDLNLFNVIRRSSKTAKGIHAIEEVK